MMEKQISDFGESFIENVRDNSLFVFEGILSGHMKDVESKNLHEKLKSLSENELSLIRQIAYKMVDLTIHNAMFFFEQDIDGWKISNPMKEVDDLANMSDGLAGELYTEDGWINLYSEYDTSI
jgi:galactokinase/mevalonate kinase-like predicted kinase